MQMIESKLLRWGVFEVQVGEHSLGWLWQSLEERKKSYSVKELWPHKQTRVIQEWGHEPRNGETGEIARKQKEHKSTETLTLAHGLTSDFWPPELQENKSLLSQVT